MEIKEENILDSMYIDNSELQKLEKLTKEQLRLVRNYYYANLDYKFKDEKLTEYYEKYMGSYRPIHENVDDKITPLNKKIINYILDIEKSK